MTNTEPSTFSLAILTGLSRKHSGEIYQGTVPTKVKRARRAANKVAKVSRRKNRG